MPLFRFSLYAGASLIVVGLLLYVFDDPRGILGEVELESDQDVSAYAVAREASTEYFDENGMLSYSVTSEKLSHFRPNDEQDLSYTIADNPKILVYQDETPWEIQANSARVSHDRLITLSGEVILKGRNPEQQLTQMLTEQLMFDPTQKLARTDEPVTILSPLGVIHAKGMIADIPKRTIKLLSQVKGHHRMETIEQ